MTKPLPYNECYDRAMLCFNALSSSGPSDNLEGQGQGQGQEPNNCLIGYDRCRLEDPGAEIPTDLYVGVLFAVAIGVIYILLNTSR